MIDIIPETMPNIDSRPD